MTTKEHYNSWQWSSEMTVSRLDMGLHTGAHVDAPCHFVPG